MNYLMLLFRNAHTFHISTRLSGLLLACNTFQELPHLLQIYIYICVRHSTSPVDILLYPVHILRYPEYTCTYVHSSSRWDIHSFCLSFLKSPRGLFDTGTPEIETRVSEFVGMVGLTPKGVRLAPKWDKSGSFSYQIEN